MKVWKVPKFFHDILGEETDGLTIALVVVVTVIVMTALVVMEGVTFSSSGLVRGSIAFILTADIIAGTIANFSKGTNDYYAKRSLNRWTFIAVHVQLVVIAWLLGFDLVNAVLLWGYVAISATTVNLYAGKKEQRILAASLTSLGMLLGILFYYGVSLVMLVTAVFFVQKVVFSFSVDHEKRGS